MNAPVLHRLIQGVVDEPVPIQEVLSFEQIRHNPDAEMVHRAGSIRDGHFRTRDGTSNVVGQGFGGNRSEEHTSELQSQSNLVCRLLLEKKKKNKYSTVRSIRT